jgi:methionyl-tRNA synthetase
MRGDLTGVTVVVAPPPTPNGPLHLGHLAGPFLAADVAARAARARGERVLTVCGMDNSQNYVRTKAIREQRPVDELLVDYSERIHRAFANAGLEYDVFIDPSAAGYADDIAAMLGELVERGAVTLSDVELHECGECNATMHHAYVAGACGVCGHPASGGSCEGCGSFTSASSLVLPRCTLCGGEPRTRIVKLPVLSLERYRAELTALWATMEMPPRVRRVVQHYQRNGLPDVVVAYPTDWGVPVDPVAAGARLDVWAEMPLGYLLTVGRAIDENARDLDGYAKAWSTVAGLWYFLGIDNPFYNTVLLPAIFIASGVPATIHHGVVVNEFYRLDGLKFSTSRNHAIWVDEFLDETDLAMVRLFLSWNRPDRDETSFSISTFEAFVARVRDALERAPVDEADVLAELEVQRAESALRLPGFDPALAVTALLSALERGHPAAHRVLEHVAGAPLAAPVPA